MLTGETWGAGGTRNRSGITLLFAFGFDFDFSDGAGVPLEHV
jgi:hypothetical protein